ncbi:hypothetical protein AAEX62_01260 [Luteococcus sp. H154]|uniref:hypothetical protein n=1 Tax=unclassified Luteococcus TaxID=2639923 RepID=UPI00313BD283
MGSADAAGDAGHPGPDPVRHLAARPQRGRHAALAGAETAALAGDGGGSGERVAREVAEQAGLREVSVAIGGGATEVSVQVSGRVDSFFGPGRSTVKAQAVMPREGP